MTRIERIQIYSRSFVSFVDALTLKPLHCSWFGRIPMSLKGSWSKISMVIAITTVLAACGSLQLPGGQSSSAPTEDTIFRPPTIAAPPPAPPTPTVQPTNLPPQVTSTPACTNNLSYVKDLTIPDGSSVEPKSTLDKRWLVKNSGSCNWNDHYQLRLTSGQDLGAPHEQDLYPARGGAQATIRILFTAPEASGTYRSGWQAFGPDGQPFGDPIFIEIMVK
jgi:hypothetical protein